MCESKMCDIKSIIYLTIYIYSYIFLIYIYIYYIYNKKFICKFKKNLSYSFNVVFLCHPVNAYIMTGNTDPIGINDALEKKLIAGRASKQ